jgi:hypothetical protein
MVFVGELDAKEVLKHILVIAHIKWRTESIGWNGKGATKSGFVGAMPMKEIFNDDTRFWLGIRGWVGGVEPDILTAKVIVVACERNQMLWPVEWFP